MATPLYATRHNKYNNNKTSTIPSLLSLKTPPLEETKNTIITPPNSKYMAMANKAPKSAALLLSYLSPFPSSSSSSNKKNSNKDRKNLRFSDANDPIMMLSPKVGFMGQIKSRNKPASHDMKKGKKKTEANILVRFLAPLFKGSSRVQDVPRPIKMLVNVTEMDPPLPVKMIKQEDLYKVSLWERRFSGKELEKLQLTEKKRQLTTVAGICFFD